MSKNNIEEQHLEDESGIKCENYLVCDTLLPKWWLECKGNWLCTNCDMMFGTWTSNGKKYKGKGILPIVKQSECPVCLETKKSVTQPRCNHTICIDCFKRMYYGESDEENPPPKFPYPNFEDDYFDDTDNPKWMKDYPLISIWVKKWNKWDDAKIKKYENEKYLRKCPMCRK